MGCVRMRERKRTYDLCWRISLAVLKIVRLDHDLIDESFQFAYLRLDSGRLLIADGDGGG
jgi:hypothetical protein